MIKKGMALVVLMGLAILCAGDASAAGFALPDQDAAAMGMAGAFSAQADNPSAAWYNPAAMARLDGTQMNVGVTAIAPKFEHENTDGTTDSAESQVFLPAEMFFTTKVNERVSAGLSLTGPFGLSTNWSSFSRTNRLATFSRIQSVDINPNVAYKVSDRLSLAAGLDFIKLEATLEKMLSDTMLFRLDGEGSGWGVNAAALYSPTDRTNLAFTYRSRIKVDVEDAHAIVVGVPFTFSNSAKTTLTLPDLFQAGISYKLSDRTTLNADLDYTWWSTYDRVVITSNSFLVLTGGATDTSTDEKQWKNTWTIRIGGQYKASDQWKFRVGYVYDQTPVTEPHFETRTPDADRQGVTIGTGYTAGSVTVDASYMYLQFKTRHIDDSLADGSSQILNGTYKAKAQLLALNVTYRF